MAHPVDEVPCCGLQGKPFTDKDLLGNFALIYFGFTFCPDICPDELDKITEGINLADKAVSQVQCSCVATSITEGAVLHLKRPGRASRSSKSTVPRWSVMPVPYAASVT